MKKFDMSLRRKTAASLLTLSLALVLCSPAFAESSSIDRGKQIFATKCAPCHSIGGGRKVGPDLRGVTSARPKTWLFSFLSDPDKLFSADDPTAVGLLKEYQMKMPNPGLSSEDVAAVISYLETQAGAPEEKAPSALALAGLDRKGRAPLFTA